MTSYLYLPLFLGNLRGTQLIIVILVVLLLFGGKKIPELMRSMGKGVNAFKQGLNDAREEINKPIEKKSAEDGGHEPDDNKA
ncbi:MAG: twin-arginine translocase TatA/TatE family subunit [Odoribacter sp.]|nr:twin-arginine translocase TatA/TatE family subunit [Odoribacter sp.]